jgi:hypothetical protein
MKKTFNSEPNTTRRYHVRLLADTPVGCQGNPKAPVLEDMWIDWEPYDLQGLKRRIDAFITRSNAQRQRLCQDQIWSFQIVNEKEEA